MRNSRTMFAKLCAIVSFLDLDRASPPVHLGGGEQGGRNFEIGDALRARHGAAPSGDQPIERDEGDEQREHEERQAAPRPI
jgi:hypothetical protein